MSKSRSNWNCVCGEYIEPLEERICTACTLASLVKLNLLAADQKTVAERKWQAPVKPAKEQKPCDVGLFSDDAKQTELF